MRLKGNKEDIILDKVYVRIHSKKENIRRSDWRILITKDIWVEVMVNSNGLIRNIYDEIKI